MNKTKIEWTGYTLNPIKGKCKLGCPYCYARAMYDRFKWDPEIRFAPEVLNGLNRIPEGSKVFLCSTHELFGEWISNEWIQRILDNIAIHTFHTFQILTKCPARVHHFDLPSNVWLGVTVEDESKLWRIKHLLETDARVKFVSFEPLLSEIIPINLKFASDRDNELFNMVDWVIVGFETGSRRGRTTPPPRWVFNIERYCNWNNIPLFIKDNVGWPGEVREFPVIQQQRGESQ